MIGHWWAHVCIKSDCHKFVILCLFIYHEGYIVWSFFLQTVNFFLTYQSFGHTHGIHTYIFLQISGWNHRNEEEVEDHESSNRSTKRRDFLQRRGTRQGASWTPESWEGKGEPQGEAFLFIDSSSVCLFWKQEYNINALVFTWKIRTIKKEWFGFECCQLCK